MYRNKKKIYKKTNKVLSAKITVLSIKIKKILEENNELKKCKENLGAIVANQKAIGESRNIEMEKLRCENAQFKKQALNRNVQARQKDKHSSKNLGAIGGGVDLKVDEFETIRDYIGNLIVQIKAEIITEEDANAFFRKFLKKGGQ